MKYLIFLLFTLLPSNKQEDEVIGEVQVIYRNGQVFLSITYDENIYKDPCDLLEHLALEYRYSCIDDSKPNTKKL